MDFLSKMGITVLILNLDIYNLFNFFTLFQVKLIKYNLEDDDIVDLMYKNEHVLEQWIYNNLYCRMDISHNLIIFDCFPLISII